MSAPQRVSLEELTSLYAEHGNVHKVGKIVGISGGSVHERLVKAGVARPMNVFTDAERERLQREYVLFRQAGKLDDLAKSMGRTKHFICRQARDLGLTDKTASRAYLSVWKNISEEAAAVVWARFKASSLGMGQFCARNGYDDLGFSKAMKRYFGDEWEHVIEAKQPRSTMYALGRQLEYRVRDDLKAHGYFVMRSPASKSPIDLVAITSGRVVFVQCKRNGVLRPDEWNEFYDLCISVDAEPVMASHKAGRGSLRYERLMGRKEVKGRRQPLDDWSPA